MSIGNPGIIGAFAATPLAQAHQAQASPQGQSAADRARAVDSADRAADASGIGRTNAEEQAGDRDADGRRMLERTARKPKPTDAPSDESEALRKSRDATGTSGTK